MDTTFPQKFPFILDTNLAKANGTGNRVCTSCDIVVLDFPYFLDLPLLVKQEKLHLNLTIYKKIWNKNKDLAIVTLHSKFNKTIPISN